MSEEGKAFGKRLQNLRTSRGLTQPQLAELTGLARSHISEMETGKRKRPSYETVRRLADALKADPADITGGSPSSATASLVRQEVRRQLSQTARAVAATESPQRPRQLPEPVYSGDERDVWGPAAAARILKGEGADEEPRFPAVPPPEHADELGPDPIGIEVEGWSLIGAGIYEGDLAWVNPDVDPEYAAGSIVIAEAIGRSGRQAVIKEVGAGDRLYSVSVDGKRDPLEATGKILARVVCIERRRKVWAPGG